MAQDESPEDQPAASEPSGLSWSLVLQTLAAAAVVMALSFYHPISATEPRAKFAVLFGLATTIYGLIQLPTYRLRGWQWRVLGLLVVLAAGYIGNSFPQPPEPDWRPLPPSSMIEGR